MTTGSHAAGVVRAKQNRAEKSSNFISIAQMLFNVPLILYSLWYFATPLRAPFIDRSFDHFTEQLPPKKNERNRNQLWQKTNLTSHWGRWEKCFYGVSSMSSENERRRWFSPRRIRQRKMYLSMPIVVSRLISLLHFIPLPPCLLASVSTSFCGIAW